MKRTTIKAVEMVRRIRDAHCELLRGKSADERIAFYRAKSGLLQAEIAARRQTQLGRGATR
jgi:hypothetical protein